jgi:hypothetical protein
VTPGGRWSALLLVAAAAIVPSLHVLQGDFVADDFGCLRLWGQKPLAAFLAFGDLSEGIWGIPIDEPRPVDALSFRLGFLVSGAEAWGHLLLALAIHAGCSLLVFAVARTAVPDAPRAAAVAAGVLFAVHPVHAEAIAWVTGKVDSLATFFYLAAFGLYLRWRIAGGALAYAASLVAFVAGLLTKEVLLTLPALLVAAEALLGPEPSLAGRLRRALRRLPAAVPFVLVALLYLVARRLAFGSFAREQRLGADTLDLLSSRQGFYLRRLLLPADGLEAGILAAAIVAGAFLFVRERTGARSLLAPLALFGMVFYAVTTAPLLLTYSSPRHLYLPSAGIAVAAGLGLFPSVRDRTLRSMVLLAAAVVLAVGLRREERHWIDAGDVSRTLRASVERLTRDLPASATVLLFGIPATDGDVLVWRAALPFALEPPFLSRSVPRSLRLLESPDLYCCPFPDWWQARGPAIRDLLEGHPDEEVRLRLLEWRGDARRLAQRDAVLTRAAIRERLEQAGMDPDAGPGGPREGSRLLGALARAARTSAVRAGGSAEPR